MTIKQAVELLEKYNLWRRAHDETYVMPNPKEIGIAIDTVIEYFKTK